MNRIPITACVITFNEQSCIADCLKSLQICDELVVVDSHSTDRTRDIAASCGARVFERDWPGYRSQKQFAVDQASHDWILFLDADEQLSPELAAEILQLRDSQRIATHTAWDIPFLTRYFGLYIHHGDWHPDRHRRLFDRRRARFGGYEIHERIEIDGSAGTLQHNILHHSYDDLDDQLGKLSRYARLMAEQMHAAGRHASWVMVFANPAWRFLRAYLLRRGFLDGWRGLSIALIEANYVRQKYLRLLILDRLRREGRGPAG